MRTHRQKRNFAAFLHNMRLYAWAREMRIKTAGEASLFEKNDMIMSVFLEQEKSEKTPRKYTSDIVHRGRLRYASKTHFWFIKAQNRSIVHFRVIFLAEVWTNSKKNIHFEQEL